MEKHPLDMDEETDFGSDVISKPRINQHVDAEASTANWLKKPTRAAIAAGIVVLLTAFAIGNIRDNGQFSYKALVVVNYISILIVLACFVMIYIGYQIPKLTKWKTVELVAESESTMIEKQSSKMKDTFDEILRTMYVTVALVLSAWCGVFLIYVVISEVGSYIQGFLWALQLSLLIVMLVWEKGCFRAYAIAGITTHLSMSVFMASNLFSVMQYGGWNSVSEALQLGVVWTLNYVAGFICGICVSILELRRAAQSKP
jgi:hypothetical protein